MIITGSQVAMESSRMKVERRTSTTRINTITTKPEEKPKSFMEMIGLEAEPSSNYSLEDVKGVEKKDDLTPKDNLKMQVQTINYLLKVLLYKRLGGDSNYVEEMMNPFQSMSPTRYYANVTCQETYFESETTNFSTTGKVCTADGREIEFNVDVSMSRSFYSEKSAEFSKALQAIDPLVINLDSNPTSVSDMKFEFDLDADGEMDEVSILTGGSAFLALDKNDNGEIDDGSELFGTSSGDGFKDLSQYDLDGNGWIDEADEIFDKLRIWKVNEDGTKELYTLKDKGVGAICLQNVDTQFSLNNDKNETNAYVRKSGVFLFENGKAGSIAHVDLVS